MRRAIQIGVFNFFYIYGVLEKEKECRTNPAGNGYLGTTSVSASQQPCVSWTDANRTDDLLASLAVDDVSKAKNYCRKLAGSQRKYPSCMVVGARQLQREEYCNISFCGKSSFRRYM